MKHLLFILLLMVMSVIAAAQEQYSRVKLFAGQEQLQYLASRGLQVDHGIFKSGVYVICELSDKELEIADESGISYEVLIEDVTKYYAERNADA